MERDLVMQACCVLIAIAEPVSALERGPSAQFELQPASKRPERNRNATRETHTVSKCYRSPEKPRVDADKRCE